MAEMIYRIILWIINITRSFMYWLFTLNFSIEHFQAYDRRYHSLRPTHWGRVTHICVSKLTIICSYNDLLPGQHQAIISTSAGILLIGPLGTNFSEILIEIYVFIQENEFENVVRKVAAFLSWLQCVKQVQHLDQQHRGVPVIWKEFPWDMNIMLWFSPDCILIGQCQEVYGPLNSLSDSWCLLRATLLAALALRQSHQGNFQ